MIKMILAEDEKELNDLICTYLRRQGYEVFACFDGLQALEVFQNNQIDVVLSDIMLPRLDGFALAESIRETNEKVPIIFLTAKDDKVSKQYGYKLGIDDYITKPLFCL